MLRTAKNVSVILVALVVLGILVKKLILDPRRKEVFVVEKTVPGMLYSMTYSEAKQACEDVGARLATLDEIDYSYQMGADWCSFGWIEGGEERVYPLQYAREGCGWRGVMGLGFRDITNEDGDFVANASCYGVRPDLKKYTKDTRRKYNILPFNWTKWSLYDKPTRPTQPPPN